jgi:hypothetical protein
MLISHGGGELSAIPSAVRRPSLKMPGLLCPICRQIDRHLCLRCHRAGLADFSNKGNREQFPCKNNAISVCLCLVKFSVRLYLPRSTNGGLQGLATCLYLRLTCASTSLRHVAIYSLRASQPPRDMSLSTTDVCLKLLATCRYLWLTCASNSLPS